ncbi:hypothetical protein PFTANZ_02295 [Plasmodium falciparum Tanzania (2000708)]|uniref:Uncharacterized protein n=1 Tax=Plasmodium falciparum Tanzania (2000708) TaxID=1036725 RepID=A0A024W9Z6_PLAFA|nr:hypothetical protein PFTANZ_02295 [Plasmodium falciparum Tanzania (2000708)]
MNDEYRRNNDANISDYNKKNNNNNVNKSNNVVRSSDESLSSDTINKSDCKNKVEENSSRNADESHKKEDGDLINKDKDEKEGENLSVPKESNETYYRISRRERCRNLKKEDNLKIINDEDNSVSHFIKEGRKRSVRERSNLRNYNYINVNNNIKDDDFVDEPNNGSSIIKMNERKKTILRRGARHRRRNPRKRGRRCSSLRNNRNTINSVTKSNYDMSDGDNYEKGRKFLYDNSSNYNELDPLNSKFSNIKISKNFFLKMNDDEDEEDEDGVGDDDKTSKNSSYSFGFNERNIEKKIIILEQKDGIYEINENYLNVKDNINEELENNETSCKSSKLNDVTHNNNNICDDNNIVSHSNGEMKEVNIMYPINNEINIKKKRILNNDEILILLNLLRDININRFNIKHVMTSKDCMYEKFMLYNLFSYNITCLKSSLKMMYAYCLFKNLKLFYQIQYKNMNMTEKSIPNYKIKNNLLDTHCIILSMFENYYENVSKQKMPIADFINSFYLNIHNINIGKKKVQPNKNYENIVLPEKDNRKITSMYTNKSLLYSNYMNKDINMENKAYKLNDINMENYRSDHKNNTFIDNDCNNNHKYNNICKNELNSCISNISNDPNNNKNVHTMNKDLYGNIYTEQNAYHVHNYKDMRNEHENNNNIKKKDNIENSIYYDNKMYLGANEKTPCLKDIHMNKNYEQTYDNYDGTNGYNNNNKKKNDNKKNDNNNNDNNNNDNNNNDNNNNDNQDDNQDDNHHDNNKEEYNNQNHLFLNNESRKRKFFTNILPYKNKKKKLPYTINLNNDNKTYHHESINNENHMPLWDYKELENIKNMINDEKDEEDCTPLAHSIKITKNYDNINMDECNVRNENQEYKDNVTNYKVCQDGNFECYDVNESVLVRDIHMEKNNNGRWLC